MKGINIQTEESEVQEESQLYYTVGNKTAAIPGSSVGRYSSSNGKLNHKELSDEELVKSFVESRNQEAFNEIGDRYGDKIYRTALRITHNPSDAEDVLQEVFTTLIEKLYAFRGESKLSTWVYRVTANESYIHHKTEEKYRNVASLEEYISYGEDGVLRGVEIKDWSDRPDEVLQSKEAMEIIEKAVNELPVAYRVIFHLRDVEGLTNHEISKILGLSLPNVKSRIHRARLYLRNKLSDYFPMNGENNLYPSYMNLHLDK
jgi:RNA polymerase sigma-70 factor, ECF subfamily